MAFRVTRRLGGGVAGGAAAAAALAIAPWWIRNAWLGNSEGLIVAFLLAAIDRHLAGDRRVAFLMAVCAGLLRPEAWPFLGLYGLWLLWARELPARLIVGLGALTVALWVLPEWWGSGDLLRAAHRAKVVNAGAPTYASNPAREVLHDARLMLSWPLLVGLALAALAGLRRRDRVVGVLFVMAAAWLGLVAYMTSDGFSGNQRYLIAPVALLIVLAAAGAGRVLEDVLRRVVTPSVALAGALAVVAGVGFAAPSFSQVRPIWDVVRYQSDVANQLPGLITQAGGADALKRCGPAATGAFFVPVVAWNLHEHLNDVTVFPSRPGVIFRVRTVADVGFAPGLKGLGPTERRAIDDKWRIVAACG
jgi:hypothetical protein